jgi:SNW domain-containing protein 1
VTHYIFCSLLPAPIQPVWDRDDERRQHNATHIRSTAVVTAQSIAPPYGQRRGWVPRVHTDYGGKIYNDVSNKL